jgi:hypothetical protein
VGSLVRKRKEKERKKRVHPIIYVGIFTCGGSMEGTADTPIKSRESLCMNTLSLLGSVSIYRSGTPMFSLPCDAGIISYLGAYLNTPLQAKHGSFGNV